MSGDRLAPRTFHSAGLDGARAGNNRATATPVGEAGAVKRTVVAALAKLDEAVDEVLYRPLVVKLFVRAHRWWLCDLAKLSMVLADRWSIGYWDDVGIAPG